jgi:hypothetical protein
VRGSSEDEAIKCFTPKLQTPAAVPLQVVVAGATLSGGAAKGRWCSHEEVLQSAGATRTERSDFKGVGRCRRCIHRPSMLLDS